MKWWWLVIAGTDAVAQSPSVPSPRPYALDLTAYYGFILRHHVSVGAITPAHTGGLELSYARVMNGRQYWERAYRYPTVGITVGCLSTGSPALGQVIYGLRTIEKRLWGRAFTLKLGLGVGVATRPFNLDDNFRNVLLGSRLNFGMRGAVTYALPVGPHWQVRTGFCLTHFSNGAFQLPNAGINFVTWQAGVRYVPRAVTTLPEAPVPALPARRWSYTLAGAFVIKEFGLPGGAKYPGGVLMAQAHWCLNHKSALVVGLDATYSTAVRAERDQDPNVDAANPPDFRRLGLALGHELLISPRLSMLTQVGIPLYRPYRTGYDKVIYQRYGLRYYVSPRAFAMVSLRSNFGVADFVEWTGGIRL